MTISPDNSGALLDDEDDGQDEGEGQADHRRPRRQNGPWNRDKAEANAVIRLMKLRGENDGMAEFLDLVRLAHGNGKKEKESDITVV
jgi:hypothetical protein